MSAIKNAAIDDMNKTSRKFTFLAIVCGGRGPDVWDKEIEVFGDDMTIRQALDAVEKQMDCTDCAIVSIEQMI